MTHLKKKKTMQLVFKCIYVSEHSAQKQIFPSLSCFCKGTSNLSGKQFLGSMTWYPLNPGCCFFSLKPEDLAGKASVTGTARLPGGRTPGASQPAGGPRELTEPGEELVRVLAAGGRPGPVPGQRPPFVVSSRRPWLFRSRVTSRPSAPDLKPGPGEGADFLSGAGQRPSGAGQLRSAREARRSSRRWAARAGRPRCSGLWARCSRLRAHLPRGPALSVTRLAGSFHCFAHRFMCL